MVFDSSAFNKLQIISSTCVQQHISEHRYGRRKVGLAAHERELKSFKGQGERGRKQRKGSGRYWDEKLLKYR